MFTDLVGFTSLAQKNEALALSLLEKQRELVRPIFSRFGGREIKTIGDAFLMEFGSALSATECAVEMQKILHEHNVHSSDSIFIKIGIHVGDVVHARGDIYGDAVNIASRIEPLALGGEICISGQVYDQVRNKIPFRLVKLEQRNLKNVELPIDVYKIELFWDAGGMMTKERNYDYPKHRLAVLPLDNISPSSNDEYFADGLTEELITALSQLRGLQVIARTSVMPYKGAGKKVSEIGRELEVGSVLEGSVRKVANKIRVTTQLIETATQSHIWSSTYDRELDDVFAIQSDIAKRVAEALEVELVPKVERRIEKGLTQDLDAYALYLKGRQLMYDRTDKSLKEAQKQFDLAISKDPRFAAAYAGYADCLYLAVQNGNRPMFDVSKQMVDKALELDNNLAEAHSTLGAIFITKYDHPSAEIEFKRAISLNPSYAQAHHWYAICLSTLGRFDDAFAEMELARKTDPLSPAIASASAFIYWCAGKDEEALKQWSALKERSPDFPGVYFFLALYLLDKGRISEGLELARSSILCEKLSESVYKSLLGYAYAISGRAEEARKLLAELENISKLRYVSPLSFALMYLGLKDDDHLFKCLHELFAEGTSFNLRFFPLFKPLRADPRFASLQKLMKLES